VGVIKSNSSEIRERALRSSEILEMGETAIYGEEENSEKYIFGIIDILTEYE
jgi:hypothetical protein